MREIDAWIEKVPIDRIEAFEPQGLFVHLTRTEALLAGVYITEVGWQPMDTAPGFVRMHIRARDTSTEGPDGLLDRQAMRHRIESAVRRALNVDEGKA